MLGLFFSLLLFLSPPLMAKDHGVHGHTFEVAEPNLLTQIMARLRSLEASGHLASHTQALKSRVLRRLRRPTPVEGIHSATHPRTFTHDPSVAVPYDLKDHRGRVFHRAGTRINPLAHRSMTKALVFIDGGDARQVAWAMGSFTEHQSKMILTSGAPFAVMEAHDRPVYFDQEGYLTRKLGIKQVPAVVTQEGLLLKIQEKVL